MRTSWSRAAQEEEKEEEEKEAAPSQGSRRGAR